MKKALRCVKVPFDVIEDCPHCRANGRPDQRRETKSPYFHPETRAAAIEAQQAVAALKLEVDSHDASLVPQLKEWNSHQWEVAGPQAADQSSIAGPPHTFPSPSNMQF